MPLNPCAVVLLCISLPLSVALAKSQDPLSRETPVPADQQIPIIDFFRPAQFQYPRLSPDGRYYAAIMTANGERRAILICDIDKGKFGNIDPTTNKDVYWLDWLAADRLLYKVSIDKLYARGIYAASVPSVQAIKTYPIERYSATQIISYPRAAPTRPLIWVRKNAYDSGVKDSGLFQIDAERTTIEDNVAVPGLRGRGGNSDLERYGVEASVVRTFPKPSTGTPVSYMADANGELAFSVTANDGLHILFRYENDAWIRTPVDLEQVDIVACGDTPGELFVMETGDDDKPRGIRRMNAATGVLGETLFIDDAYDAQTATIFRQPLTNRVIGFGLERALWQNVWLEPKYAEIQKSVEQQFPKECVRIFESDDAEKRFFIATWSDRKPTAYYLADLEKRTFTQVASTRPWIDPSRMRPTSIIRYKTRDGFEIEAYLTLPAGASKASRAPLVVLPHGGPWVRDNWSWDPEVQFLASRGYAVFQPNYRGSDSYAWRFPASDLWEFRKMHNDVTDGVATMKRTGLIDPDRIAIMGASFGGYLALCGAAFEPDTYRCAITFAGVFDWERMIREMKNLDQDTIRSKRLLRKLGDPAKKQGFFEEISPLRHLDSVKIPVFVAHGKSDHVVDIEQSKRLVAELQRRKIPCVTQFEGGEAHGMSFLNNRIELYTKVERFLATNLAPRSSPVPETPAPGK